MLVFTSLLMLKLQWRKYSLPSLDCTSKDVSVMRQAGGKGRTIVEVVCRPGRKEQKYKAVSLALQGMSTVKIPNFMQAPKTSKEYKGSCESCGNPLVSTEHSASPLIVSKTPGRHQCLASTCRPPTILHG